MNIKNFAISFLSTALVMLSSCSGSDGLEASGGQGSGDASKVKRTILVYAVNKSSLATDFPADLQEMKNAMQSVDNSKYRLLLFRTDSNDKCGLYEYASVNDEPDFKQVVSYPRDVASTHPDRIRRVIDDALALYPNSEYDLFFWGHGMSWTPYFTDHTLKNVQQRAYGGEYNSNGYTTDWTDIDDLANAIPDGKFNLIWMDCCYMAGIEPVYEFKGKCDTFVGYPTEVWSAGMPYDKVLPLIFLENRNIPQAAEVFYDSYSSQRSPVTVAVIDMNSLEDFAEMARNVIQSGPVQPEATSLLNYSRTSASPYYDLRQFLKEKAVLNGAEFMNVAIDNGFAQLVKYHAESDIDFNRRPWNKENISGLSTHLYKGGELPAEQYYRKLKWYKRVYE
ncbi:MAG: clostripain-related cysteine peptidase [Candidatus Amulumruptor caecigallinarius]|nr:clostripain-related cysteine peptidase [Candidatus Amulumruptor caecigallinarius]